MFSRGLSSGSEWLPINTMATTMDDYCQEFSLAYRIAA
jgi:hypothetical protein